MRANRGFLLVLLHALLASQAGADTATLSVNNITLSAGQRGEVVISGDTGGNPTYGVDMLVWIRPRPDSVGTLVFTPAPPIDIRQEEDPWPNAGVFTVFDTNGPLGFGPYLNAMIDDDERWLCNQPVDFSGPLVSFPVVAGPDAEGVWDVWLTTYVGDSRWECVDSTTLINGTITVSTPVPTVSEWGMAALTAALLGAGAWVIARRRGTLTP